MKNWKKYAAIIGVLALLMIFCLPMYFALKGDFSQKQFMASLFTVLFVAVMCYVLLMLFKYLNKKKEEQQVAGEIKNVIFDVGKVLVDYDWESYLDSFGFAPEKRERIANATFLSPVWEERRSLSETVSGTGSTGCRGYRKSHQRQRTDYSKETICGYLGKISEK